VWASGFYDEGSVEEVGEPFISQECDVFRMSRSAEKLFTKALHLSDPWEVFSVNIDDTETRGDITSWKESTGWMVEGEEDDSLKL